MAKLVAMQFESRKTSLTILLLPFLLSFLSPVVSSSYAQDASEGLAPWDQWDQDDEGKYITCEFDSEGNPQCEYIFPWGGNEMMQFKEYYTFETIKARMMEIARDNPDIIQFHEGLNGGTNARGEETSADTYEGWHYGHSSPWLKITKDVEEGEYNAFNGDTGNYADRPDIMIVGNHHAREWMSHTTPMLFLETVAYYYDGGPVDNDGDGKFDEDPWGDADGDGQVDEEGDW